MINPENHHRESDSHQAPGLGSSEAEATNLPIEPSGDFDLEDHIDYGQIWHGDDEVTSQPEKTPADSKGDYNLEVHIDYGFTDYSQLPPDPAGPQAGHNGPDPHHPDA